MTRPPGRAIYTAMLNEAGGFESDLMALRLSDEVYRLSLGTAALKRDLAWLRRQRRAGERVALMDETGDFATLALMGPRAPRIAAALGADALNDLGYFRHAALEIGGLAVRAARLSYVGEAGWEIACRAGEAERLYGLLREAGARPSGLYAQTAMRIEKRFLALGHDLDADVSPLEAGLDFAVAWERDFIGREALLRRREAGPESAMATIVLDDGEAVPLGKEPVYRDGAVIGQTTSAAYGYRIGRPLALAYLKTRGRETLEALEALEALEGARVEIDIARRLYAGRVRLSAAFDPRGDRMRPHGRDAA